MRTDTVPAVPGPRSHLSDGPGGRSDRRAADADPAALLAEERERIARDLHDLVIQRLFVAGIGAQALECHLGDDPLADRARAIADEVDASIRDLRTAIFRLAGPQADGPGTPASPRDVRDAILTVADELQAALGTAPRVVFRGVLETTDPRTREQLLAVLRECLTNVARHARATEVVVEVDAQPDHVVLRVSDDGVGPTPGSASSPASTSASTDGGNGHRNLARRARALGGEFRVAPRPSGGTVAECRLPTTDGVGPGR